MIGLAMGCGSGSFQTRIFALFAHLSVCPINHAPMLLCHSRSVVRSPLPYLIRISGVAVFCANQGESGGEMREDFGILDARSWSLIAVDAVYKPFFS